MRTRFCLLPLLLACFAGCATHVRQPVANARSANGLIYDLVGEGPLVVLIHGSNLDRRLWDAEVEWLKEHVTVLRYDLRGQGRSDFPEDRYSNEEDLLALLKELDSHDVTLVGLSAGAQVAVAATLDAPRRVCRIVLVSPSISGFVPKVRPPFFEELASFLSVDDLDRANEVLIASPIMAVPPEHEERIRTMVEENIRLWSIPMTLLKQPPQPAFARLEEIEAPTLILLGENDVEAIRELGPLLQRRIADARLVTIPGGGHLLNLTSPELFRETLSEFLGIPGS